MSGSLEAVLGPAALRFFFPIRVVGGGGGSYLGLSFYRVPSELVRQRRPRKSYLFILVITTISARAAAHVRLLVTLCDDI